MQKAEPVQNTILPTRGAAHYPVLVRSSAPATA